MLIYHPAFDGHHGALRQLMLLARLPNSESNVAQLRILDFYLLFPAELGKVTFPSFLRKEKKHWSHLTTKYNRILDPRRVFDEIRPYQEEAIRMLAASGVIKMVGASATSSVSIVNIPDRLLPLVNSASEERNQLLDLLTREFSKIDLYGASGLKARTGLFEYRYDPT